MPTDYESCRDRLAELTEWHSANRGARNEATTRLHLIDTLLFECLGWSQTDAELEEPHEGLYTDYTLRAPRRILIVEAKKEGEYFEIPAGKKNLEYSIPSLFRDFSDLRAAIKQATDYCQSRGVPFGAVTNGHQLVAFLASREDGTPPLEGTALVFPSLGFMEDNFHDLWQALSKPGVEERHLKRRLAGDLYPQLPPKLSGSISGYPGTKNRNVFQTNLQIVSELVVEDITRSRDLEPEFLKECYCKSGALSQHSLVSKSMLRQRYAALFRDGTGGPTVVPAEEKTGLSSDILAESLARRPILLLGDAGVGKTTFIRHLIHVDAPDVFENAISFYIDLGTQATLTGDLKRFIVNEIESQLRQDYGVDVEERNFVRGVYNLELERFRDGIYGDLKETAPDKFREKELELLKEKISDRPSHLRESIDHIAKGRQKQVVVFIDNSDQREYEVQQQAFLIAQELAEHWPATVFVSLRPETFHKSQREGALSGYHPKAFSIAPPRMDQVLHKRLDFAVRITRGEVGLEELPDVDVRLTSLESLLSAFLNSLHRNDELIECIDNIAAGNIRRGLDLVKQFFGSGHVDTKKIVEIYERQGRYLVPLHEFLRAVIFGDAEYYHPGQSPVLNIFDISQPDRSEHFLTPILMNFLISEGERGGNGGFVETEQCYDFLQGIGFVPDQIDWSLNRCLKGNLVESAEGELGEEEPTPALGALRVTPLGAYHSERLSRIFSYVDAMIVDTPVLDRDVREGIEPVQSISARLERAKSFQGYLDESWYELRELETAFDWSEMSNSLGTEIEEIEERISG